MEIPLTRRELDAMQVLWDRSSGTVAEVREHIETEDALAYTTVLTVLRVLERKGLVRHEAFRKAYRYYPKVSRADVRRGALSRLIRDLYGGQPDALLEDLLARYPVLPKVLERMRRMLDKR